MPHRCFLTNFEVEHELADPHFRSPPRLRALAIDLACGWRLLADTDDEVVLPQLSKPVTLSDPAGDLPPLRLVPKPTSPGDCEWIPWGWSEPMRRAIHEWGGRLDAQPIPSALAVRAANHRARSDTPLGCVSVRTIEELRERLAHLPEAKSRWVLKSPFGMSARERLLGTGRELSSSAEGWVKRILRFHEEARLEPWYDRIEEASYHLTITPERNIHFDGVTRLLSDPQGRYLGNETGPDLPAVDWGAETQTVGELLSDPELSSGGGYFGPVSVDAMRCRLPDEIGGDADPAPERWRFRQDINARTSMGRLALVAGERFRTDGDFGMLRQIVWGAVPPSEREARWERLSKQVSPTVRVRRLTPFRIGEHETSLGLVHLTGRDRSTVREAERLLLQFIER